MRGERLPGSAGSAGSIPAAALSPIADAELDDLIELATGRLRLALEELRTHRRHDAEREHPKVERWVMIDRPATKA